MMKKVTKKTTLILLFLGIGILFGYTAGTVFKDTDRSEKITEVLKENCDCKEINQIIYAKGIQFGENGITTEKGEYQLVDCNFKSVKEETAKIYKVLKAEIKNFVTIQPPM